MRTSLLALCAALVLSASSAVHAQTPSPLEAAEAARAQAMQSVAAPLSDAIDQMLTAQNLAGKDATKVVPIVGMNSGRAYNGGMAHVSGPRAAVDRVNAVLHYKGTYGAFAIDTLVPIDSINPAKGFKRVYGTAVDAVVNAHL